MRNRGIMKESREKEQEKILVTRSSMPELEEYVDEIRDIWETHWLTNMGEKHKRLQRELEDYLKVENVELLTNGHMALEMAIQAMNLQGEVITVYLCVYDPCNRKKWSDSGVLRYRSAEFYIGRF